MQHVDHRTARSRRGRAPPLPGPAPPGPDHAQGHPAGAKARLTAGSAKGSGASSLKSKILYKRVDENAKWHIFPTHSSVKA